LLLDDPTDTAIPPAVEAGFLVRSFLDDDPAAAEATGAHMLSGDHPADNPLPDAQPVRCNPVRAPSDCTATALEDPARMAG